MMCMFESTSILEQNLSSFRALHKDQKHNMKAHTLRRVLKVMLDCDAVVNCNILSKDYSFTEFGLRAFNRYRSFVRCCQECTCFGAASEDFASSMLFDRSCSFQAIAGATEGRSCPQGFARGGSQVVETCPGLVSCGAAQTAAKKLMVSLAERVTAKLKLVGPAAFTQDARERLEKFQREDREQLQKLEAIQLRELKDASPLDAKDGLAVCVISKAEITARNSIIKEKAQALHKLCGMRVCQMALKVMKAWIWGLLSAGFSEATLQDLSGCLSACVAANF